MVVGGRLFDSLLGKISTIWEKMVAKEEIEGGAKLSAMLAGLVQTENVKMDKNALREVGQGEELSFVVILIIFEFLKHKNVLKSKKF